MIARPATNHTELGSLPPFRAPDDSCRVVSRGLQAMLFQHARNVLERVKVPHFLEVPSFVGAIEPEAQPDCLGYGAQLRVVEITDLLCCWFICSSSSSRRRARLLRRGE
jgi:hypothetical protein